MKFKNGKLVQFILEETDLEAMKNIAKNNGTTLSSEIRRLIRAYINENQN